MCGTEIAACEANADCVALYTCYDSCADDACYDTCANAHPTGAEIMWAFWDCSDASCAAACGGAGGDADTDADADGDADGDVDPTGDPCLDCAAAACTALYTQCASSADCIALNECELDCGDNESCWYACEDAHPASADVYLGLLECMYMSCNAECYGG
jgi:hypothetical protein